MTTPSRLAMIIGSTRPQRFADKPADWLMEQAAIRDDLTLDRLDLRDFDLPMFAEAASNLHAPSVDPKALAWQDAIRGYDGFIFIVAEYNHSITGALKNALDQAYVEWVRAVGDVAELRDIDVDHLARSVGLSSGGSVRRWHDRPARAG